jgi:hypothetical protein
MIFSENRCTPRIKSGAGFFGIMLQQARSKAAQATKSLRNRRGRFESLSAREAGPFLPVPDPYQFSEFWVCLPVDLAALAAWAVMVAHHTTLAPMGKFTSLCVVAEGLAGKGLIGAEQHQGRDAKKREQHLSHICSPQLHHPDNAT